MTPREREDVVKKAEDRSAIEEAERKLRRALREAGKKLYALSENTGGELAGEARLFQIYAMMPFAHTTPDELAAVVTSVTATVGFLDNWSDCSRREMPVDEEDVLRRALPFVKKFDASPDTVSGLVALIDARIGYFGTDAGAAEVDEQKSEWQRDFFEPAQEAVDIAFGLLLAFVDARLSREPSDSPAS